MNNEKQAYTNKVEAKLEEWEAQTQLLTAKSKNLAADAQLEYEQQLENLEDKKSEFVAYYDELLNRADDSWESFKDEAETKWKEFSNSIERFTSEHL